MTKVYRTRQGEEKRRAYSRSLIEPRLAGEMTPPDILDAVPLHPDGLLPRTALDAPIRIQIPEFQLGPIPSDGDTYTTELVLQWRRESDIEFQTISDMFELKNDGTVTFPLPLRIEMEKFAGLEGQYIFRYYATLWAGNNDWSQEVRIRLDRTAPYGHLPDPRDTPPPIEFTSTPITDATLSAQGGVECIIPDFDDPDKGRIIAAIGWSNAPPDPNETIIPAVSGLLLGSRKMTVTRDKIERLGSGTHYVTYVLVDPAGNVSKLSRVQNVPVALGALPTNLQLHSVPLAADGLINRADAFYGVTVDIPLYTNHEPTDHIFVEWGATTLPGYPVGEVPPAVIRVPVSWTRLKAEYDFSSAGVQTVKVGYRVDRAPQVEFRPTPRTIDVDVDFSTTGPIEPGDPDPDPVSPRLGLVTVYSSTDEEDELAEADFGEPATAKFKAPDPTVDGDIFTLYWKGVAVDDVYEADGAETPGVTDISIIVTWDEIVEGGLDPALPVHYVMSNDDFPNNDRESRTTHVWVRAIRIVLDPPLIPDMGSSPVLNCNHLRSVGGVVGYRVKIPASSHLEPGKEITMRWRPFDSSGTTPINNANKTTTIPIPNDAPTAGIDWFIEYAAHVLPTDPGVGDSRHAFVEIDYSIEDVRAPSEKFRKMMSIALGSDNAYCDLDSVVPAP